jgi:hypothetical protein
MHPPKSSPHPATLGTAMKLERLGCYQGWTTGVLNAATGGLGRWAWTIGLLVWLGCASVTLMVQERRSEHEQQPAKVTTAPKPEVREVGS